MDDNTAVCFMPAVWLRMSSSGQRTAALGALQSTGWLQWEHYRVGGVCTGSTTGHGVDVLGALPGWLTHIALHIPKSSAPSQALPERHSHLALVTTKGLPDSSSSQNDARDVRFVKCMPNLKPDVMRGMQEAVARLERLVAHQQYGCKYSLTSLNGFAMGEISSNK